MYMYIPQETPVLIISSKHEINYVHDSQPITDRHDKTTYSRAGGANSVN